MTANVQALKNQLSGIGVAYNADLMQALDELARLQREQQQWAAEKQQMQEQIDEISEERNDARRELKDAQKLVRQYEPAAKQLPLVQADLTKATEENADLVKRLTPLAAAAETNALKVTTLAAHVEQLTKANKSLRGKLGYLHGVQVVKGAPDTFTPFVELVQCFARDLGYGDEYLKVFGHYAKPIPAVNGWHPTHHNQQNPKAVNYAMAS